MNQDVALTLDEAVQEVLGLLTGLDLTYSSQYDRYRSIARCINRALRQNALEQEWGYYSSIENVGTVTSGDRIITLRGSVRVRKIGDDSVRLADDNDNAIVWISILPRDALSKYVGQPGLYCSVTRNQIEFNRALPPQFAGLNILVPVMREPRMFKLPPSPATDDPDNEPITEIDEDIRNQTVDFDYPDLVIARAAWLYAQTDPIMQPRVQTLEAQYKDLGYQLIERDEQHTDSPFLNEFFVPIQNGIGRSTGIGHQHPHSDYRR